MGEKLRLVPVIGFIASVFIVALHWLQVGWPPSTPDPISSLGALMLIQLIALVGLAAVAGIKRRWIPLALSLLIFAALLTVTGSLWVQAVGSV